MEKPERIRRKMLTKDISGLRAEGKKGGKMTALKKPERIATTEQEVEHAEILNEIKAEKIAYEEAERLRATNEDMLSPDGEALET